MTISLINLNADLGESFGAWHMGDDPALLQIVNSANVACGFHAGDPAIMRDTVRLALQRLQSQVRQARISLRDVNGPKGGADKQCQIMLTTAGHGRLVIVSRAEHAQGALNQALQRATHTLARLWQRKRRPARGPKPS